MLLIYNISKCREKELHFLSFLKSTEYILNKLFQVLPQLILARHANRHAFKILRVRRFFFGATKVNISVRWITLAKKPCGGRLLSIVKSLGCRRRLDIKFHPSVWQTIVSNILEYPHGLIFLRDKNVDSLEERKLKNCRGISISCRPIDGVLVDTFRRGFP